MNVSEIIQLIQAVSDHSLTSFELKEGEMKLSIKKEYPEVVTVATPVQEVSTLTVSSVTPAPVLESQVLCSDKVVTSPLVGTYYSAPSPDANVFVRVGDTVKKGQVLGIIEAMKLMNEIECEYDGVVEAILVENEDVVEYGQPLMRIR